MKVLLISALLVLTSDVACAQHFLFGPVLSIAQKTLLAIAVANPLTATGVIISVVAVYGVALSYTVYRDVSALNMWVERITQRLKENKISTEENSCWCIDNPPPPLEQATWTLSFFSKVYAAKLSTICSNDDLKKMKCQGAVDDCKAAVHIIRSGLSAVMHSYILLYCYL